jgi:hypothetical protein
VAEFATRLSSPANQIWLAMREGKIVGSVAIDGEDLGQQQAHLRWFILDDSCGEPALAGGSSVRRWLSAIVVSSAPFSCGRLKVWTRPANCMNPLASR